MSPSRHLGSNREGGVYVKSGRSGGLKPGKLGLKCKATKYSDADATIRRTPQATTYPGSDALSPPGSVGQVSNKQAEALCHRKDNFHVAYGNVQNLLDAGVRTLTTRELRKRNVDIACLSEVRIPNSGHSVTNVPGEEAYYHLYRI